MLTCDQKVRWRGLWLCNSDLRQALARCYASLDLSEYVILYVHLSPIVDYYQKNVSPCYVLLIAFQKKKDAVWRASSKDGIAAICSHQGAINKCFFYGSLFLFLSLLFFSPSLFRRHFSSFRWHQEKPRIIGIHLLPIGFIHVLLLNWYIWPSRWLSFQKWNSHCGGFSMYVCFINRSIC